MRSRNLMPASRCCVVHGGCAHWCTRCCYHPYLHHLLALDGAGLCGRKARLLADPDAIAGQVPVQAAHGSDDGRLVAARGAVRDIDACGWRAKMLHTHPALTTEKYSSNNNYNHSPTIIESLAMPLALATMGASLSVSGMAFQSMVRLMPLSLALILSSSFLW